jgi:hypothetical protein
MMDFISQHKIASLIILLLLIGAAWWGFTANSAPAPVIVSTTAATSTQDAQLVSTLLQLQAVTLSGTILSDPGFLALQDYTTQVVTEPIGRPNPFAPLSSTGATEATSTTSLNPNLFAPAKH